MTVSRIPTGRKPGRTETIKTSANDGLSSPIIDTDTADGTTAAADQFLRLMSHEMRTPLNGVIGMLGLLARTRLDGAQRAYVGAARDSAEHLLGLVNDLLDYARLEAGKLEFDAAPVDLEGLVRGVAELLSPRAHDKGVEIVWTVAPEAVDIMADEGRLRQVLFNLAGNAVKFTTTGAVRIAVERVGGSAARPKLAFVVDDTGPGIPVEARKRIFEEFGHADAGDATRHDGAGLGLAVVARLAQAMEGSVTVEDRPDDDGRGGSRFRFIAVFDRAPKAEARARTLEGLTVAIATPEPLLAETAREQIEASGGQVHKAAAVTLVDHALAQSGSAGSSLAPMPTSGRGVIMLRPSERALIDRYRSQGFHGYLIKPLRRSSVAERVLAALNRTPGVPTTAREDDRVTTGRHGGVRVLLAEDNPVGALLARTLLRREGCVVETAGSGHEAVEAMARARYDLVLMDVRMPGMDGLAATRAVRRRGDTTPILALTANAFVEDRRACLEAGMNDHLVKPLEPEALKAALARWTSGEVRAKVAAG
jgi:CheY-like chemotaxis protein